MNPIEADDDNEVADQDKTQNEKTNSAEDRKRVRKRRSTYESYNQFLQKFMAQRNAENAQFVEFMKHTATENSNVWTSYKYFPKTC